MKSWHILNIVNRLLNHETVCIKSYAMEYERSIRSIQRDFESIKEFYGEYLVKINGDCYTMTSIDTLRENINKTDELKSLIDLYYMMHPKVFHTLDTAKQTLIQKLYQKSDKYFTFKHSPYEILSNEPLINTLKKAIGLKRYTDIEYQSDKRFCFGRVKPLKIVFVEGNWYLALIDNDFSLNNGFRWLRIGYITDVKLHNETFIADIDAQNFIHNAQTLFSGYKKPLFCVTLKVDKSIARFFTSKKHLRSQKILKEQNDGSLILEYEISNDLEILPLVKKWMPSIAILSPKRLQEVYLKDLQKALNDTKNLLA